MIVQNHASSPAELGFSLKPPKWARKAISSLVGKAGIKVAVPTPAGPVEVNRDTIQNVIDQASRATVTVGPREEVRPATASTFVEQNVPGGYVTIGLVALAALLLLRRGR